MADLGLSGVEGTWSEARVWIGSFHCEFIYLLGGSNSCFVLVFGSIGFIQTNKRIHKDSFEYNWQCPKFSPWNLSANRRDLNTAARFAAQPKYNVPRIMVWNLHYIIQDDDELLSQRLFWYFD